MEFEQYAIYYLFMQFLFDSLFGCNAWAKKFCMSAKLKTFEISCGHCVQKWKWSMTPTTILGHLHVCQNVKAFVQKWTHITTMLLDDFTTALCKTLTLHAHAVQKGHGPRTLLSLCANQKTPNS